jgi:hypothetical protein
VIVQPSDEPTLIASWSTFAFSLSGFPGPAPVMASGATPGAAVTV